MPSNQIYRKLRIFIACPGDVTAEKDCLVKVVERLQKPADECGYFLDLIEWRQVIGMGRPQQVIFDRADPQAWDIFVGILWQRFGSPSGAKHPTKDLPLESGTHEEFLKAYGLWKDYGWPRILFYRCIRQERVDKIDPEQLKMVADFFADFDSPGAHPGIYRPYSSVEDFGHFVYDDIRDLITGPSKAPKLKREVEEAIAQAGENAIALTTQAKDLVREVIDYIGMLYESRGAVSELPTGFVDLDRMISGLHPGEMIVITGHAGIGKTALAMNIVEHVSVDVDKAVAVFSLGMTSRALMSRLLCSRAKVNLQHLRNGFLSERDFPNLTAAATQLAQAKLHIDDTPRLSMSALLAKTRQLKSEHDIQLVMIDYFQLLRSASRENNRPLEISEISADLKQLAKEISIPVIIVAQLNRQPITGSRAAEGGLPRLSDLWELGSLEQDADMVGLLVRPEYYETDYEARMERAGEAALIVAKHRNGPTGEVPLTFLSKYIRFETRAREF